MKKAPIVLLLAALLAAPGLGGSAPQDPAPERHRHSPPAGHGEHPTPSPGDPPLRHRGPMDHSFADAEAWARAFESEDRDEWQKPGDVVAALALEPGMTVADVGSGTGYFARRFAAAVGPRGTVFATDIEPEMAVYVRRRAEEDGQANVVPVLASPDDPRLPDGSVDLVFICNTWHHIGDRVDYAHRLATDLAPGGRVAIVDFLPGELPVGPGPEHKLSAAEVEAEFQAAGYRLAAAPEILPYQYVLLFEPEPGPVAIRLGNGSAAERRAHEQLERLLAEHDLERWLFTREVLIDENERIPHSHPVLTLNPSSLDDDLAQLATFVHEQFHWYVLEDQGKLARAIAGLRELYPEVPGGGQGARSESSTYLHLVVCDLELQAMTALVGEERAREVLAGWRHYPWIYEQVLTNPEVRAVNERFGMVVP